MVVETVQVLLKAGSNTEGPNGSKALNKLLDLTFHLADNLIRSTQTCSIRNRFPLIAELIQVLLKHGAEVGPTMDKCDWGRGGSYHGQV